MHRLTACLWLILPIATDQAMSGYSQKDRNNEMVTANKWMQTSEYQALMQQGFNMATDRLNQQAASNSGGRLAIIADIDETLLEGRDLFSRLIGTDDTWTADSGVMWWQSNAQLNALPGALDFSQQAREKKVDLFYISGRPNTVKESTLSNLQHHKFYCADEHHLLLQPPAEMILSKAERRQKICDQGFSISLQLGDQLEDLDELPPSTFDKQRLLWVKERQAHFGMDWIIFPNPLYGLWEKALSKDYQTSDLAERHRIRSRALSTVSTPEQSPEAVQAILWQHFSGSYHALAYQAFNRASQEINSRVEHTDAGCPAVIMHINDIARIITHTLAQSSTDPTAISEAHKPVCTGDFMAPGAHEFLQTAHNKGITVFYVTCQKAAFENKKDNTKALQKAILENFVRNNLLEKNETSRLIFTHRAPMDSGQAGAVSALKDAIENGSINGKKHTVILSIGHRLEDFDLEAPGLSQRLADSNKQDLGRRYILLPDITSPVN